MKTCIRCGRVGTRGIKSTADGDFCRKTRACVTRVCDKVFLDPPPKLGWPNSPNDWTLLGTLMVPAKIYVVDQVANTVPVLQDKLSTTIEFQVAEVNSTVLSAITGGNL